MRRQLLSLTIDLLSISLATLLAVALRDNFELRGDRILALLPYLGWTLIAAAAVLPMSGTTRPIWRFSSMSDYARIVPAVISIVLAAMASGFVFNRLDHVSRVLPLTQGVFMIFLLVGSRVAFRLYHSYRRSGPKLLAAIKAADVEMVLLVGVNRITELYLVSIDDFAADRIRVVGVLGKSDRHTGRLIQSVPVLGIPEDANIVLNELAVRGIAVNRIVVTMAFDRLTADAQQVLLDIERNSDIKLDLFGERLLLDERQSLRAAREDAGDERHHDTASFVIGEETLQELSRQHYWRWKRAMDVVFAAVLLVACAPLFLFVGLLVAYDVGWPVTFWQQRPGLGG